MFFLVRIISTTIVAQVYLIIWSPTTTTTLGQEEVILIITQVLVKRRPIIKPTTTRSQTGPLIIAQPRLGSQAGHLIGHNKKVALGGVRRSFVLLLLSLKIILTLQNQRASRRRTISLLLMI